MGLHNSRSSVDSGLDLQSLGCRLVVYPDFNTESMPCYNPSIAFHDGELKIAVRQCNFTTLRHKNWTFLDERIYSKSFVLLGTVDPDTLEVFDLQTLKLGIDTPIETRIAGLEDVRLFSRDDGLHAIGFEVDRVTPVYYKKSGMAEYLIKGDTLHYKRTLVKPDADRVEKNWQPADVACKNFDFTYSPTEVWKSGKIIGKPYDGEIHGGSQLLLQSDGSYLSLVHKKTPDYRYGRVYDRFIYVTYLARHNAQGIITEITRPFNFGTHENIEFASGMVEHDGHFIVSLGIRDAKFALARIERHKLLNLLEPIN